NCSQNRQELRGSGENNVLEEASKTLRNIGSISTLRVYAFHRRFVFHVAFSRRAGRTLLFKHVASYSFSISARRTSFVLPSFCWRRPSNSSSFPSTNVRSSSVN